MGRSQPICVSLIRGPSSATLDYSISPGTAVESWRGTPLEICNPSEKTDELHYPSPCRDLPSSITNTIMSATFHTHTHDIDISNNTQKKPHTKTKITSNHALALITNKNNTYLTTLREKPTHKKTFNKYTHYLKIKRDRDLTLLFYTLCIQNKTHKENLEKEKKKKNKQQKEHQTLNHTIFYLQTSLWRRINSYNNTKRTNHQKRKSARIWTYRKNILRTITKTTKHIPIFRSNIRSLYRSALIKIRRITNKLYNQVSHAFYKKVKKYTQGSRENLFIRHPPKSNIPNQTIHPNDQQASTKNIADKQPDNRLRTLLKKLIKWTSGEAYIPGHTNNNTSTHKQKRVNNRRRHKTKKDLKAHEGDVIYRFHNVQGLGDKRFRPLYLERARATCDVLAIAEANWSSETQKHRNGVKIGQEVEDVIT